MCPPADRPRYTVRPVITPLPSRLRADANAHADGEEAAADAERAPVQNQAQAPARVQTQVQTQRHAQAQARSSSRDPFLRPETEDDDGYDPYSDRPPAPEPIFQEDPWK